MSTVFIYDFSDVAEVYNFERDVIQLLAIVAEDVLVHSLAARGDTLSSHFAIARAKENVVGLDIPVEISDRMELLYICY